MDANAINAVFEANSVIANSLNDLSVAFNQRDIFVEIKLI